MTHPQAPFAWYELMTADVSAATEFYRAVLGWSARDSGIPGEAYTILGVGERAVAGLMEMPAAARDAGAKPGWLGYVAVPDIEQAVEGISAAGGTIHRAVAAIAGVGHFAVVADPQGAVFVLFQAANPEMAPPPLTAGTPGTVGWHELHAAEWQAAFDFYAGRFGWTKDNAVDMGPMGIYQLFAIDGVQTGGMMTKMDAFPRPVWIYYFNVDKIDAAVGRVKAAGGQIINGPHPVPGGSWIAQGLDPQGAMFAMVSGNG